MEEITLDERAEALKRLLDSNNAHCPTEMLATANDCNIENHNPLMVKHIVCGRFAVTPLTKLNAKTTFVIFSNWLKVFRTKLKANQDKLG